MGDTDMSQADNRPSFDEILEDKDAAIAERDAEIERLKEERDHHQEYAKSAKRESTFWYNKSEWDRFKLYKAGLTHEKREAALLAFVGAFDGFYEAYCYCVDSSDDFDRIDEAREQLRGIIDAAIT